jgi:NADH-quinone oxidoreductase subunit N
VIAFCFAAMLFSLAGIPPLAGFFAKLYVFAAAIEAGLFVLVVIAAITTVIGAYYYIRIVKVMYFDEPVGAFEPMPVNLKLVLAPTTALVLLFFLPGIPSWIVGAADAAARSLF